MKLKLNKKFYALHAINSTIEEFKEICDCGVSQNGAFFEIELKKKKEAEDSALAGEFCNHCLSATKHAEKD